MIKSESIKELATSLSKFQGEIKDAPKNKEVKSSNSKGPSYKHADLAGILEIARPILTKYELSVIQLPGSANNIVTVETVLMHSSGEWISSTLEMAMDAPEFISGTDQYGNRYENRRKGLSHPQEVGKYITFARRYGIAAILGISQIDDEESMIEEKDNSSLVTASKKEYTRVQKPIEPIQKTPPPIQENQKPMILTQQVNDLRNMIGNDTALINYLKSKYKVERLEECTQGQYFEIKDELRIMKSTVNDSVSFADTKFTQDKVA